MLSRCRLCMSESSSGPHSVVHRNGCITCKAPAGACATERGTGIVFYFRRLTCFPGVVCVCLSSGPHSVAHRNGCITCKVPAGACATERGTGIVFYFRRLTCFRGVVCVCLSHHQGRIQLRTEMDVLPARRQQAPAQLNAAQVSSSASEG